jgi:Pyruvate/2-oxoacid:ferredoxin oxidoreductase delta subunit
MTYKLIPVFKRNTCEDCIYYCSENKVCQSKKVATSGCHPYVDWFDRHFCKPYMTKREK